MKNFSDAGERSVKALQVGLAVGLLVLVVMAEWSTASVQWPILLLVLVGALLIERRQRGVL